MGGAWNMNTKQIYGYPEESFIAFARAMERAKNGNQIIEGRTVITVSSFEYGIGRFAIQFSTTSAFVEYFDEEFKKLVHE